MAAYSLKLQNAMSIADSALQSLMAYIFSKEPATYLPKSQEIESRGAGTIDRGNFVACYRALLNGEIDTAENFFRRLPNQPKWGTQFHA